MYRYRSIGIAQSGAPKDCALLALRAYLLHNNAGRAANEGRRGGREYTCCGRVFFVPCRGVAVAWWVVQSAVRGWSTYVRYPLLCSAGRTFRENMYVYSWQDGLCRLCWDLRCKVHTVHVGLISCQVHMCVLIHMHILSRRHSNSSRAIVSDA